MGIGEKKFQASNRGFVSPETRPRPEAVQEPAKTCLIRTKDAPMTQGIPRVLGPLCQELRQRLIFVSIVLQIHIPLPP